MNNEIVKDEVIEETVEAIETVAEPVEETAEAAEEVAEVVEEMTEEVVETAEEAVEEATEVKSKVNAIVADALQKVDASLSEVKAMVQDKVQKLREKMAAKEKVSEETAEAAEDAAVETTETVDESAAEEVTEETAAEKVKLDAVIADALKKAGVSMGKVKSALAAETAKAKAMVQDKEKMQELANKAQKLCEKLANLPVVGRYFRDIPTLCQIIRDYVTGVYKECPLATIIAVSVALLYLINPFDLVPDAIPLLGVADDIAALTLVLEAARNDLESYRKWKAAQKTEEEK